MLFVIGCDAESSQNNTITPMQGTPIVIGLGYDSTEVNEKKATSDIATLKSAYDKGDLVSGYFLGLSLIKSNKNEESVQRGVTILEDVWENGLVDAGFSLHSAYYNGLGVEKNKEKSFLYLKKSAERGYLLSQRKLGLIYAGRNLDFIKKSQKLSLKWFLAAANNQDKSSALNVSAIYNRGDGVKKDLSEAFSWLIKSEDMKYGPKTLGFGTLGRYYEKGLGTDVNLVLAYKYYDLAQPAMDADKARIINFMNEKQIEEGKRLSLEWQKKNNSYNMTSDFNR